MLSPLTTAHLLRLVSLIAPAIVTVVPQKWHRHCRTH